MRPAAYLYSESYMLASPGKSYFFPIFCFKDFMECSLASQNKISIIDVNVSKKGFGFHIHAWFEGFTLENSIFIVELN